jgi:transposase
MEGYNAMTTAELELIEDAEVIEPLTERQAISLDKKIRAASDKVQTSFDGLCDKYTSLCELLNQASEGQIHVALGYSSWTAYIADAVQINTVDRIERKGLAKMLSGGGMSQRAIASTLGVSQKTVDRDLEGEEFESDTVTSLDGKQVSRNKAAKEIEEEYEPEPPAKATPVTADFKDEIYQLQNDVEALKEVMADERFAKNRKRIGKSHGEDLRAIVVELDAICDEIVAE